MAQGCIFCEIINKDRPGYIVYEDDKTVAFLDIRPLFPGHVLLVPRIHYETLPDLPLDMVTPLFHQAQVLSHVVKEVMGSEGTFVAMNNTVSQSVPHLHVHIVPRTKGDGLRGFFWPRQKYRDDSHREEVCNRLAAGMVSYLNL